MSEEVCQKSDGNDHGPKIDSPQATATDRISRPFPIDQLATQASDYLFRAKYVSKQLAKT